MADKIRLGLIGASVRGTWSARSHLPALQASGLQKMFRELASKSQDTARRLNFRGRIRYGGEDTAGADRRQRQG